MVAASGDIYVVDEQNHCVQKFDSSSNFLTKWGSQGRGDGEFINPLGIAVDTAGNVYVADRGNHRIQKFDSSGNFLTKWGTWGFEIGEFRNPSGVAVDAAGNVYVADQTNGRIQVFEPRTSGSVSFTANTTSGPAPLTIRFTDQSAGDPESWYWEFGDGSTSTGPNPVHIYRVPGTYTVNLTINTQTDPVTLSRPGYITVTPPRGDVTGDGIIDISDVAKVAYMVVGRAPADLVADFNGNGRIDIGDAAKIAYFVVGEIETL